MPSSLRYQTVLFDWDGCLAKTLDAWLEAYQETFAEYGLAPSDYDISHKAFGQNQALPGMGIPVDEVETFWQHLEQRADTKVRDVELYPAAETVLQQLKAAGVQLALLTTSPAAVLTHTLDRHNLRSIFELIITADDTPYHKPDRRIIDQALNSLNGNAASTIIVGDSKSDLGAALNAGIDSCLFYPQSHELFYDKQYLITEFKPTHIVDALEHVAPVVLG